MRRVVLVLATMALAILLAGGVAQAIINGEPGRGPDAHPYVAGSLVRVSGTSPFAGSNCGLAGQTGKNFLNSEVEPFVDVSPAKGENIIGVWQQDRWSNGASRGNVVGASLDGGKKWKVIKQTKNSLCTGGTAANGGGYERASDPWVTISPTATPT